MKKRSFFSGIKQAGMALSLILALAACGVPGAQPVGGGTAPTSPTVEVVNGTEVFPGVSPGAAATTTPGGQIHSGKGTPEVEPPYIVAGQIPINTASLTALLKQMGAAVEETGKVQQPFIPVMGTLYRINGAEVQVFEFEDDTARQAVSDLIPADGSTFSNLVVDWIALPHFWASGRVIVLYVGEDEAITGLLDGLLGKQINDKG